MTKRKPKAPTRASKKPASKPKKPRAHNLDYAKFIEVYLSTLHIGNAAKAAGSRSKNLTQAGNIIMKMPDVAAKIQEIRDGAMSKAGLTIEVVMKQLARIVLADPRKFFEDDGSPKEISDLEDDVAAVLVAMDVEKIYEGSGKERRFVGTTMKYKLADKLGAIDKAMRHLGLFEKDNAQGKELAGVVLISAKDHGPR